MGWAEGMTVSITELSKLDRQHIQQLIESEGGSYSPGLSRRCTHLIVPDKVQFVSEKLIAAVVNREKWDLAIVKFSWFQDCITSGRRIEETPYELGDLRSTEHTEILLDATDKRAPTAPDVASNAENVQCRPLLKSHQKVKDSSAKSEKQVVRQSEAKFPSVKGFSIPSTSDNPPPAAAARQPPSLPAVSSQLPSSYKGLSDLLRELKEMRQDPQINHQNPATFPSGGSTSSALLSQGSTFTPSQKPQNFVGTYPSSSAIIGKNQTKSNQRRSHSAPTQRSDSSGIPSLPTLGSRLQAVTRMSPASAITQQMSTDDKHSLVRIQQSMEDVSLGPVVLQQQGLFAGVSAFIDPEMPEETRASVAEVLKSNGGCIVQSTTLYNKATHAICPLQCAAKWLALGISVLSPEFVPASARAGQLQRVLTISADAARSIGSSNNHSLGSSVVQRDTNEAIQSQQARQAMVDELNKRSKRDDTHSKQHYNALPASTPSSILADVIWSVNDAPSTADKQQDHGLGRQELSNHNDGALVVPDSEDEDELLRQQQAQELLISATQLVVDNAVRDMEPVNGNKGNNNIKKWMHDVVFKGQQITLLYPVDGTNCPGGHSAVSYSLGNGNVTAGDLLDIIYSHYQESIPLEEQFQLLQQMHNSVFVSASGQQQFDKLQKAFIDGETVKWYELLGSRLSLEGLQKLTRDPLGAVYELKLAG